MHSSGLEGRIAFVTGATGGIGAAVVRQLLDAGCRVAATDLEVSSMTEATDTLCYLPLDVTDADAVEQAVGQVEQRWGAIDFGVNVAGVLATDAVIDTSPDLWRRVFDVNTHGVFHVSRALAARMQERRRGALVTVGSNAAGVPRQNMAAYAASKAASHMFTRCLGLELGPYGIRCNIVAPGSTLTPMQTGMWADENGADAVIRGSLETFKAGIPLGRLAVPDNIADAVLFLLSERASHITMATLYVDGGATLTTS